MSLGDRPVLVTGAAGFIGFHTAKRLLDEGHTVVGMDNMTPLSYVDSNVTGTLHVLEGDRHQGLAHLLFASTTSVYGLNGTMPVSEVDGTAHLIAIYAATKKATETSGASGARWT